MPLVLGGTALTIEHVLEEVPVLVGVLRLDKMMIVRITVSL